MSEHDKTRAEIDAELLAESKRHERRVGHICDDIESVGQMADFIRENFVENLFTLDRQNAITYLIDDLNKMKSEVFEE